MSSTSTTLTESQLGSGIRIRRPRRSSASTRQLPQPCPNPLSGKFEQIDLSSLSPAQALAFLRFLVLSYLADLEASLAQLESVDLGITEALKAKGELTIDEAKQRVRVALQMLEGIRAGVSSHLPEVHFADMTFETLVTSHLPDVSEMRSHLPDMHMPSLQGIPALARHASKSAIPEVRSHLPDFDFADVRSKLDDVRTRIHDLDFHKPLSYIPVLSDHLQSLQLHLSAMAMELPSSALLSDLLEALLSSDLLSEFLPSAAVISEGEDMLERAANQIAEAVNRSLGGAQLIRYVDLPDKWKNNPFVAGGYRFIPLERWPLILLSVFALHNETLNIHSHLLPFLLLCFHTLSSQDVIEITFNVFALLCLLLSAVWHTMSGCAHPEGMEFCARVDYVGIGWLISASVGTVVHYGFRCHPFAGNCFLGVCFVTGILGSIFPFMSWFNKYEYRKWRIIFFLLLAFSAAGPLAYMSCRTSPYEVYAFIRPVVPSIASYLIGLAFYATHFPERFLSPRLRGVLDRFGGGSHAIWHALIVLAIALHRGAIGVMKEDVLGYCFV